MKAFDTVGNRELWSFLGTRPEVDMASFHLDPTGTFCMRLSLDTTSKVSLFELPSHAMVESYETGDSGNMVCFLSPGAQHRISFRDPAEGLHRVQLLGPHQQLLMVANRSTSGGRCQFSKDGRFAVWGNDDGTVTVFEPAEVKGRLAQFHLEW